MAEIKYHIKEPNEVHADNKAAILILKRIYHGILERLEISLQRPFQLISTIIDCQTRPLK
jgi:hypothetical protein